MQYGWCTRAFHLWRKSIYYDFFKVTFYILFWFVWFRPTWDISAPMNCLFLSIRSNLQFIHLPDCHYTCIYDSVKVTKFWINWELCGALFLTTTFWSVTGLESYATLLSCFFYNTIFLNLVNFSVWSWQIKVECLCSGIIFAMWIYIWTSLHTHFKIILCKLGRDYQITLIHPWDIICLFIICICICSRIIVLCSCTSWCWIFFLFLSVLKV
jgi:hypothetical protein